MNKEKITWHSINIDTIFQFLNTSEFGLTNKEAKKRQEENGSNVLPKSKTNSLFKVFIKQFYNPILLVLLIAGIFSVMIGEVIDCVFILAVVFIDVTLGCFQEWRAEKNAANLQNLIRVKVYAMREGKKQEIDSEDLVIGDIVLIEPGNKIGADIRIFNSYNLTVNEAFLTGESIASNKYSHNIEAISELAYENICYAGSTVMTGRGIGVVISTASDTEIGKIAQNVITTKSSDTPLVIRMNKFTKQIGYIVGMVSVILFFILYNKGYAPKEIFFIVVALSVSAIPEGLPVVLTVTLSIATSRMAKKNVVVRKLNAVESLGSCTVIASDKTGTLTLNEQTAKMVILADNETFKITGIGYNGDGEILPNNKKNSSALEEFTKMVVLNNEGYLENIQSKWISHGDSIDVALLAFAKKLGITKEIEQINPIIGTIPYESEKKYSAVFFKHNNNTYATMKGSVETVLSFCDSIEVNNHKEDLNTEQILKQNNELALLGYRVLGVAKGLKTDFIIKEGYEGIDIPKLSFLGLIAFIDPIRDNVKESIKNCHDAGIKVIMITGDHPLTAGTVAAEIGIIKNASLVVTGNDIVNYKVQGEKEFDDFIKKTQVFSRVTPMQKLDIIESFRRQGEFIAVTGDGVNDAPAMKKANIGIAMGSGTDVAKDASLMIITDDNFSSIVGGIEEGRFAYDNIRKVIYMLISTGLSEMLFILFSIVFGFPVPLIAVQLLWLNLVTDGIQDIALAFEKGEQGVMKKKPRKPNEKIFDKLMIQETLLSGVLISIIVFGFWVILIKNNINVYMARSYILLLMVFMQNIHILNCRSEYTSVFKLPLKNNPFIIYGIVGALALQLLVMQTNILSNILKTTPVSLKGIIIAFILAVPLLIAMELFKSYKRKCIK